MEFFEGASINLNKDPVDNMKEPPYAFMKHVSTGERVPKPLVQSTLCKLGQISGGLGKRLGEQQDANEFYMQVLSPFAVDIDEKCGVMFIYVVIRNSDHTVLVLCTVTRFPEYILASSRVDCIFCMWE